MLIEARDLVGQVFEAEMRPITADVVSLPDGLLGRYLYADRRILVSTKTTLPLATFSHEFGHALWNDFVESKLGGLDARDALPEFVKAYENTKAIEAIRLIHRSRPRDRFPDSQLDYWTKPEEVFCRAIAQIVSRKTRNPKIMEEVDKLTAKVSRFPAQWDDEDFVTFEKHVLTWLESLGVQVKA